MARGTPSVSGAVTAMLDRAPLNAVISVSRYTGANSIGNVVAGNTNGVNGGCSGGTDSSAYSFSLPAATSTGSLIVGVAAIRNRTKTSGAGYVERAEIAHGSGGDIATIAVEEKAAALADIVNGSLNSIIDWAVIGVELRR